MTFRLLVVEDNEEDLGVITDTIERYVDKSSRTITVVTCKSVLEASSEIDNSFDGAIIDMKLGEKAAGGNEVLEEIVAQNIRIPIAVVTGTPAVADGAIAHFDMHSKGSVDYADILDQFWGIHQSGLTKVMGARGKIEDLLNEVYKKNLLPQKASWISNGEIDAEKSEAAILRHTLNHLIHIIDQDNEDCFPEEFYISPPYKTNLSTGGVYRSKENEDYFVVLSPACDLAVRQNGSFKTCHIQLVRIESLEGSIEGLKAKDARNKIKKLKQNNFNQFNHYLPETKFFQGGLLNFRQVNSVSKGDFEEKYGASLHQISSPFLKDIVGRFSSYYARQGQPEICDTQL